MKFSQQKAPFPSSNQCWSSLSCSPVSVTNFIFFSFFFLETKTVLRLQRQNQLGRIFLPYSPHPDRMILSHNSQSKQCSENPALHANVQTVLPQEWSLFGHGVSRSWLLSSEQTQAVQQEIQIQGKQKEYLSCFLTLCFDFTAQKETFSDAGSQQPTGS